MKLLFDHQIFQMQIVGGISRYFVQLIKQFSQIPDFNFQISLKYSNNLYLRDIDLFESKHFFIKNQFPGMVRIFNMLNRPNAIRILRKQDFSIFHPTFYDPYFINHLDSRPFVLTVYDLINEIYSQKSKAVISVINQKKILIEKATKIIAISENTKKDLIRFYKVAPEKIQMIYLANSLISNYDKKANISFRYFVYVGNRNGYKNFEFLIFSLAKIFAKANIFLICIGGPTFTKFEKKMIEDLGIHKKVWQLFLTDSQISTYYCNALALIFPSRYEGFGIPLLEAFACNCPVLSSNSSSLPEVGGDACLYFDPYNAEDLCAKATIMIENEHLRKELIEKGQAQLKKFSWIKTAEETIKVYKNL